MFSAVNASPPPPAARTGQRMDSDDEASEQVNSDGSDSDNDWGSMDASPPTSPTTSEAGRRVIREHI